MVEEELVTQLPHAEEAGNEASSASSALTERWHTDMERLLRRNWHHLSTTEPVRVLRVVGNSLRANVQLLSLGFYYRNGARPFLLRYCSGDVKRSGGRCLSPGS